MKLITLTQGKFTQVDDNMYEYLNQWKWCAAKSRWGPFYAVRSEKNPEGKYRLIKMHHLVIGITRLPKIFGLETDHIDGEGLNNQRVNLRITTVRKNQQNREMHRQTRKAGAFPVQRKDDLVWKCIIRINGKRLTLGRFPTEQEAHERYLQEIKIRGL